jgi:hypothetical protein
MVREKVESLMRKMIFEVNAPLKGYLEKCTAEDFWVGKG